MPASSTDRPAVPTSLPAAVTIEPITAFKDNYIWCIRAGGRAVVVDPGEAAPVLAALQAAGLRLAGILLTHHHADHIGGVAELVRTFGPVPVYGPADDRITEATVRVRDGDRLVLDALCDGGLAFDVLEVPGHTSSHVALPPLPRSATALMQAGAQMVKLEGGGWTTEVVHFLVQRGIPVCAHLGLTPQTVHALGGYRVQGKSDASAELLTQEAHALQEAGASMLVLEMVPADLSASLTQSLTRCATIGIGAGKDTAGQVLVLHDMLGVNLGKMPKFVRNFMADSASIRGAMEAYVAAVKDGSFPVNALHAW